MFKAAASWTQSHSIGHELQGDDDWRVVLFNAWLCRLAALKVHFSELLCYVVSLYPWQWSLCHWHKASDWPGAGRNDCGCLPGNMSEEHASRCSSTTHAYVNTPCLTFRCDNYFNCLLLFSVVEAPPHRQQRKEADKSFHSWNYSKHANCPKFPTARKTPSGTSHGNMKRKKRKEKRQQKKTWGVC